MAVKSDLRSHTLELKGLLKRVAAIESASGISGVEDMNDLFIRVTRLEDSLADEATMGPKKLAMKFGARMNALDERLQELEHRDKVHEAG